MAGSYLVYEHVSPSGKRYIGVTSQEAGARWKHGYGYSYNDYFMKAIKKYGWDAFQHNILYEGLSKEEAAQREIDLISKYRSDQRKYGYNIARGGEGVTGYKHASKIKEQISEKMIGNQNHLGKVIYQFDLCGNYITQFTSVSEASRVTGTPRTGICDCTNITKRPRYSAGGFIWISSDNYTDAVLQDYVEHIKNHLEKTNRIAIITGNRET